MHRALNYEGDHVNPRFFAGAFDLEQSSSIAIVAFIRAVLYVVFIHRSYLCSMGEKTPSIQIWKDWLVPAMKQPHFIINLAVAVISRSRLRYNAGPKKR